MGVDALGPRGVPGPVGRGPGSVHVVIFRDERSQTWGVSENREMILLLRMFK